MYNIYNEDENVNKAIDVKHASFGLYLSKTDIYEVNRGTVENMKILKNGETLTDNKLILHKSDGHNSRLEWDFGKNKAPFIDKFIKQVDEDIFLQGLENLAIEIINSGHSLDSYTREMLKFVRDNEYALTSLESKNFIAGSNNYKVYESKQYMLLSLYVEAAKQLGTSYNELILKDIRMKEILHNMRFNANGMAEAIEKKAYDVNKHLKAK